MKKVLVNMEKVTAYVGKYGALSTSEHSAMMSFLVDLGYGTLMRVLRLPLSRGYERCSVADDADEQIKEAILWAADRLRSGDRTAVPHEQRSPESAISPGKGEGWRVPDGWKLVPVEPDEKMKRAAIDACPLRMEVNGTGLSRTGKKSSLSDEECCGIYRAMLAAVPSPPISSRAEDS